LNEWEGSARTAGVGALEASVRLAISFFVFTCYATHESEKLPLPGVISPSSAT
jgi:hypothetical protein